jgi:hypothetical protein
MESYQLTRVDIAGLSNAFILETDSTDKLLLSPGRKLLGYERQKVAFTSTVSWLNAMMEQGYFPESALDLCTLTVMAEAIGHNLSGALSEVLAGRVYRGDNWIGVSRFALKETGSGDNKGYTDYDARVTYMRLHSVAPVWCLLDTVATGATLVRGLKAAFQNAEKPRRIIMGTPAGSPVGMRKIEELCRAEGIEFFSTFFGAAFGLWQDGSGLPWCHPDTVYSGTARSQTCRQRAAKLFNNHPAFCAVGDCSANFFDVQAALKHLQEEEEKLGVTLTV